MEWELPNIFSELETFFSFGIGSQHSQFAQNVPTSQMVGRRAYGTSFNSS